MKFSCVKKSYKCVCVCLESDVEEFEDNPEEYIRKDIEKSDSATRRRAACDFLQALCIFFESQVIALYSQYIDAMQKVNYSF